MMFSKEVHYDDSTKADHVKNLLHALVFEHIFAYICDFFRKWEIKNYGILDMHGIYRGKRESHLQIIEIVIDCMIMGFSYNHLSIKNFDEFHEQPFQHYWIIIDCLIMIFKLPYVMIIQYF